MDESKVALQALEGMQPELVERIEIYRSAGAPSPSFRARKASTRNFGAVKMVRIYTKRYVSTLPRQDVLPLIVYMGHWAKTNLPVTTHETIPAWGALPAGRCSAAR